MTEYLEQFLHARGALTGADQISQSTSHSEIMRFLTATETKPTEYPNKHQNFKIWNEGLQKKIDAGKAVDPAKKPYDSIIELQIDMQRTLLEQFSPQNEVNSGDATSILRSGFITQMKLPQTQQGVDEGEADDLISILVSKSVQRDVQLPPPGWNETKVEWFKDCIDKLMSASTIQAPGLEHAPESLHEQELLQQQQKSRNNIPLNSETAMRDLQFAHEYLTKKYADEVATHARTLTTRKQLETQLATVTNEMARVARDDVKLRHDAEQLKQAVAERDQAIYKLERELALLRVEHTPLSTSGAAGPNSGGGSSASSSVSLLRTEFKRIVQDLNRRHAEELRRVQDLQSL